MYFADLQNGILRCRYDIWKSTDGGSTWHETMDTSPLGNVVNVLYPNKDTAYFIVEQFNSPNHRTVYRSTDGAETWTPQMVMSRDFTAGFYDGKHGYGFGELLPSSVFNYLSTSDAASSWSVHAGTAPTDHPNYVQFINSSTGIAQGDIYQFNTFDGGLTWNNIGDAQQYYISEIFPGGILFRMENNRNLQKSSDYGNTWKQVFENSIEMYLTDLDLSPSGFGCAVYGGRLLVSRDFGETWEATMEIADEREGVLDGFNFGSLHILNDHTLIATGRKFNGSYNYGMVKIEIE
jgi:photosystem II stability/assembly factor-like uncharacterized protein